MKTAEQLLLEKGTNIISVNTDSTIQEAIDLMIQKKVGAIAVKENYEIVGIWTERDLLHNIRKDGFNCEKAQIKNYMTTDLITATHDETVYNLMDKFLGKRLRHLFIKRDEKIIGILSIGDVVKETLNTKTKELEELHAMVSWDYYNNWRWEKK